MEKKQEGKEFLLFSKNSDLNFKGACVKTSFDY